ncbi:MAG: YciI family protein [Candidatus Devosia phytovorans]|uniref:YciI family protein n=1 Tax=Candidatus Devosia phytovorans TaxID=3121372 RepID=A0AAJ6AZL7_9HYPH|nr:YciI family protein [Devosia sp.]WEK04282.1 MAG: YciI family protein [Devosia sp.]
MLYALIAKDKPGMADKRQEVRPVHLQHLESIGEKLRLAGALLNEDGVPEGSIVVVEAETIEQASDFFNADPFVKEGIFASTEIKRWRLAYDHMSPKA